MLHVVLIEPEIPWNTGNIGRTCLGAGAELHLVGRLGFHLDNKQVQRAGLDYWDKVVLHRHETWEKFLESLPPHPSSIKTNKDGGAWPASHSQNLPKESGPPNPTLY